MWKKLVSQYSGSAELFQPSNPAAIPDAEHQLGLKMPSDLAACLLESNGIEGEYGLSLVWPISRIVTDNLLFWSNADFKELYMPFDHMLFFADAGNGDQFFYPITGNQLARQDIYVWKHEDDSRAWVAPSLEKYLEWLLSGRIVF